MEKFKDDSDFWYKKQRAAVRPKPAVPTKKADAIRKKMDKARKRQMRKLEQFLSTT